MKFSAFIVGSMLITANASASGGTLVAEVLKEEVLSHLRVLSLIATVPGSNKKQCMDALIRGAVDRHASSVGEISDLKVKGSKLNFLDDDNYEGGVKDELSDILDNLFDYKFKLKASSGKYEGELTSNFIYDKENDELTCYAEIFNCAQVPVFELKHKRKTLVSIKPIPDLGACDVDGDDIEDIFD